MTKPTERDIKLAQDWWSADTGAEDLPALLVKVREEERARWLKCAVYDATMEGPVFRTWNRSELDRLRKEAEERMKNE